MVDSPRQGVAESPVIEQVTCHAVHSFAFNVLQYLLRASPKKPSSQPDVSLREIINRLFSRIFACSRGTTSLSMSSWTTARISDRGVVPVVQEKRGGVAAALKGRLRGLRAGGEEGPPTQEVANA
jgi:hypothetical protein